MIYPQITGEPNFILIGISAVFGLLLIIIVYYIVVSKSSTPERLYPNATTSGNANVIMPSMQQQAVSKSPVPINTGGYFAPAPPATSATPGATVSNPNLKQVFNVRKNIYTLEDAPAVCGALGAELASIDQLMEAHRNGADWCNVGWTKDGIAAYPVQYSTWKTLQDNEPSKRGICGRPGINLVRNDPDLLYGVNCYGIKPEPKGDEKIKQVLQSDAQIALNAKIAEFQKNMNSIGIAPWSQDKWSQ